MARNVTGEVCLDDDEMVTLDFNDGQIIKSGLPNNRKEKFFPSVAGFNYYWLRIGGHRGNVGLKVLGRSPEHTALLLHLNVSISWALKFEHRNGENSDG